MKKAHEEVMPESPMSLRPYQKEGLEQIVQYRSSLVAWDMGTLAELARPFLLWS